MRRFRENLFGGHRAPAARGRKRATVRLEVEGLEERNLMAGPMAPVPYTPDTVFKLGNYWIDVPAGYDATHQTPAELLVWSHGCGGQSGGDIYNVLATAGGPTYITITVDGREGGCWDVNSDSALLLAAIADVKTHFNIDPQRVVLGGYSSGGDLSYRVAFTHSTEIAGVLAENTTPFRDTGLTPAQALAAPFHFHIVHLAHTEDDTYPIDVVRSETGAVRAAGSPGDGWATLQLVERPGNHYDDDNGNTGTVYDMKTYLLPHLADGWTSPVPAAMPPDATALPKSVFVAAADAGGGPDVKVFGSDGKFLDGFFAFDAKFTGGVRVAVGDVNGDGFPDVICAAGPGGGPNVIVFSGKDRSQIANFFAFDINFTGGCFVVAGDVNGDGFADIIVGADAGGGPNVFVLSGKDRSSLSSYFPYNMGFTGGVRVAAGDVNNDGRADIITGAGAGGGPNVTVYQFVNGQPQVLQSYFAFNLNFGGGIFVGAGDVNGDGKADVIAGSGPINAANAAFVARPTAAVFSGADATELARYPAFPQDAAFLGAVRVAASDTNGDARAEVVTVHGPGGTPDVNILSGLTGALLDKFFVYDPAFTGGIFLANTPK